MDLTREVDGAAGGGAGELTDGERRVGRRRGDVGDRELGGGGLVAECLAAWGSGRRSAWGSRWNGGIREELGFEGGAC